MAQKANRRIYKPRKPMKVKAVTFHLEPEFPRAGIDGWKWDKHHYADYNKEVNSKWRRSWFADGGQLRLSKQEFEMLMNDDVTVVNNADVDTGKEEPMTFRELTPRRQVQLIAFWREEMLAGKFKDGKVKVGNLLSPPERLY